MFSRRTAWSRDLNPLTQAIEAARARYDLIDLSVSNATKVNLPMDRGGVAAALAHGAQADYEPAALGIEKARVAVSDYYGRRGVSVDPAHVVITSTTSEAYTFLFRLLADPGDTVLAATPSYPLFDSLAEAAGVQLTHHALDYEAQWRLNPDALSAAMTPRTKALLSVAPGNPTGACPGPVDRRRLVSTAEQHGLPIISDEVFLDYLDAPERFGQVSMARNQHVLTFTLSGLSKVAALPHLKLSWMVISGPESEVQEALARLEFIADTYLSVATPVQEALPRILELAEETQDFLRDRLWNNAATLKELCEDTWLRPRHRDGGWYAIVDLPDDSDDEQAAIHGVEQAQVITQPGFLFDLEDQPCLVLSLLPEPEQFRQGLRDLLANKG